MTIARLPGVDLHYQVHGDGRPIVFVHGAGGNHAVWWAQAAAFQRTHRVVVMDQRGFGASRPTGGYNPGDATDLTADLANLLDTLAINEPAILVGHSLGTLPVLDFAEANPQRVAGVVLSSAYGGLVTEALRPAIATRAAMFAQMPAAPQTAKYARSADEIAPFAVLNGAPSPLGETTLATRPDLAFLYATLAAAARGPALGELAGVFASMRTISEAQARAFAAPALVIGGAEDGVFPPAELALAATAFANARLSVIEGAGHSAYFEQADAFNAELAAFTALL
jgi:3-oxoadipate enol-lactonase